MSHTRTALIVVGTLTLAAGALAAAQAAKGDLWEVTSQPSMEGLPMKMPSNTSKVCASREWKEPPGGQKNCKSSNMKIEGTKVTWDVKCTGPTMTGHGEITREGADAYTGTIAFKSDDGNLNVALSGKRLGDCDNPQ